MNGEVGVSSCLGLIFARCFDAGVDDTAKLITLKSTNLFSISSPFAIVVFS
jgi:hypothetical protein